MESLKVVRHFQHAVIVRSAGLLPMLYAPRELEQELGVPSRTIREWIKKGMPHERDHRGRIWINGVGFAEWVEKLRRARLGPRIGHDEAYCLRCQTHVKLIDPKETRRGKLVLSHGKCPTCGGSINRGRRFDQSE